jgi:hypothetical protein
MADNIVPASDLPDELIPAQSGALVPDSDMPAQPSALEQAKTALEQTASGATLGASKVLETHGIPSLGIPPITTPEAIKERETNYPGTALASNVLGTSAMIYGTGGLGALGEAGTVAGRIGLAGLEGAGIGGVNQATDDWSQNKPLDAQRIAAASGLGALWGLGGSALVEGVSSRLYGAPEIGRTLSDEELPLPNGPNSGTPPGAPPLPPDGEPYIPKGYPKSEVPGQVASGNSQPVSTTEDAIERNTKFAEAGGNQNRPSAPVVNDALDGVNMVDPNTGISYNPRDMGGFGQMQLESVNTTDPTGGEWGVEREKSSKMGDAIRGTEAAQKQIALNQLDGTIDGLAPSRQVTSDSYDGGKDAIESLGKTYQNNAKAESQAFESLKTAPPLSGNLASDIVDRITNIPDIGGKIANMIEEWNPDSGFGVKEYNPAWGIDRATYNSVKEMLDGAQRTDTPNTLESLWNLRKGLDQNIDMSVRGKAPEEIGSIKKALMDQMIESSGNPALRDSFKRYAINEEFRSNIERAIGASLKPENGELIKAKPEKILKNLFSNTATIQNLQKYLQPEDYNHLLANYIKSVKGQFSPDGVFSSAKFGTWLHNNRINLDMAFQDNPGELKHIQDLNTVMRYLPDAKTLAQRGLRSHFFERLGNVIKNASLYPPDAMKEIGGHLLGETRTALAERAQNARINARLAKSAAQTQATESLQDKAIETNSKIEKGIRSLFSGASATSRRDH